MGVTVILSLSSWSIVGMDFGFVGRGGLSNDAWLCILEDGERDESVEEILLVVVVVTPSL